MIRLLLFALSLSINLATISRLETSERARISDQNLRKLGKADPTAHVAAF
jgi:hypothetical protein